MRQAFLAAPDRVEQISAPLVSGCVTRVQLEGSIAFLLCLHPIPVEIPLHGGQRCVPFGERAVYFQRLQRGLSSLGRNLHWSGETVVGKYGVTVGQAGV